MISRTGDQRREYPNNFTESGTPMAFFIANQIKKVVACRVASNIDFSGWPT